MNLKHTPSVIRRLLLAAGLFGVATALAAADVPAAADAPEPPPVLRGFMSNGRLEGNDFKEMKEWGANLVRLQIQPTLLSQRIGKPIDQAWPQILDMLEAEVKAAEAAGLKVAVAMMTVGGFPWSDKPKNSTAFWDDPRTEQGLVKAWTDIATRLLPYGDTIYGYDIFNEPLDRSQLPEPPQQWHGIATRVTEAIRKIDPNVWIICETGPGFFFTGFSYFSPLPDERVIYSGHFYEPDFLTHQGIVTQQIGNRYPTSRVEHRPWHADQGKTVQWNKERLAGEMQAAVDFQNKYNVPIYVGEFSVVRWAKREDSEQWLRDVIELMEERGWSWTYHAFREFNGWSLEHADEEYFDWKSKAPRPQPVSYETGRARIVKDALGKNAQ